MAFSSQAIDNTLFPGLHYDKLGKFLFRSYEAPGSLQNERFVMLYDLGSKAKIRESALNDPEDLVPPPVQGLDPVPSTPKLMFLRGFPSPGWLNSIGARYTVDPEYYLRHMPISSSPVRGNTHNAQPPSLPNTIELAFFSVGDWDSSRSELSLQKLREECNKSFLAYMEDLQVRGLPVCSPVVRCFHVHDKDRFSIQQRITIHFIQKNSTWILLVWNDAGADLCCTAKGPWKEAQEKLCWRVRLRPIVQHRQHLALRSRRHSSHHVPRSTSGQASKDSLPQTASWLCYKYGQFMNAELMKQDAFYALHDVFLFAAASQFQFLAAMDSKLSQLVMSTEEDALHEIQLIKSIMEENQSSLQSNLSLIRARGGRDWARVSPSAQSSSSPDVNDELYSEAERAALHVEDEFRRLEDLCARITLRCKDGISACLDRAIQNQALRTIQLSEAMKKLAILAYFFAPMSLTASIFNITFVEFPNTLHLWLCYCVIIKLLLEKGAKIEAKDSWHGRTLLSWAARNGHEIIVKLLLEKVESKDRSGRTPLSWAAGSGHKAIVKLLLEKGTNVKAKDKHGWTPLSWAAENGHEATVKLLLEKGANVEAKGEHSRMLLSQAAGNGHEAIVKLLQRKSQ
ncbi:hypothetical protein QQZ08_009612 [Neonectria magnoliae]|uniref:Uncharacterized protein n=1 Tax=Neonectria magnoliae TaxID=2732573 RepID=A0ABR1HMD9_9HYPO